MQRICIKCIEDGKPHHEAMIGCYKAYDKRECKDCPDYVLCFIRFDEANKNKSHGICDICFIEAMIKIEKRRH